MAAIFQITYIRFKTDALKETNIKSINIHFIPMWNHLHDRIITLRGGGA